MTFPRIYGSNTSAFQHYYAILWDSLCKYQQTNAIIFISSIICCFLVYEHVKRLATISMPHINTELRGVVAHTSHLRHYKSEEEAKSCQL
jgi:hypothetical protein